VVTNDNVTHFIGCNSPPPTSATGGGSVGWTRLRWGDKAGNIMPPAFPDFLPGNTIVSVAMVFDEGIDTGPDNSAAVILDNIDINGILVGRASGPRSTRSLKRAADCERSAALVFPLTIADSAKGLAFTLALLPLRWSNVDLRKGRPVCGSGRINIVWHVKALPKAAPVGNEPRFFRRDLLALFTRKRGAGSVKPDGTDVPSVLYCSYSEIGISK